jgi:acyl-CoA reductase-like NAD-dependent aldehyde dehydrogenase
MPLALNDPNLLRSACYVGGEWVGTPALAIDDPATGKIVGRVPDFGTKEAEDAVLAAEQAFRPWARLQAKQRAAILRRWFELILTNSEDLARLMTAEQGKPLAESRGEVAYAASFVEFNAEEAKRIYGETVPSPFPKSKIIVQKQPIGVCAAITPWNFPAAMITRKCSPGLAAGYTFVVKPAPDTPLTAFALVTDAKTKGARVVTGGGRHALGATFYTPTVLTGATIEMTLSHEEIFGPVAAIYRFESEEEVVRLANATPYGLAAYFYTKDISRTFRVADEIEAGMIGINAAILGNEVAPFGGVKESGLGREGGRHGIEEYVEMKYLLIGGLE